MKQIYDNKDIGETIDKSFDAGIKEGYRRCREQMMQEAVEKTVFQVTRERTPVVMLTLDANEYKDGDKVQVIICKKEDKK